MSNTLELLVSTKSAIDMVYQAFKQHAPMTNIAVFNAIQEQVLALCEKYEVERNQRLGELQKLIRQNNAQAEQIKELKAQLAGLTSLGNETEGDVSDE